MEFAFKNTATIQTEEREETKTNQIEPVAIDTNEEILAIIDQYCAFFDKDMNKEVLHMAMENVAKIIVKMQDAQ